MKLSVLIPVYNDRDYIERAVAEVKAVEYPIPIEIVAVDDGSTDGSREVLAKIEGITSVFHEKNQGKGAAIRTALKHATGDILAIQDDDCEYDPAVLPSLIEPIIKGEAQVVYGSRFLGNSPMFKIQRLQNKAVTTLGNMLLGQRLTDFETGHKIFSRSIVEQLDLQANGFEFDMEITIQFVQLGYKIKELPTRYEPRTHEQGKKISYKDGIRTVRTLLKYTIGRRRHRRRQATAEAE